MNGQPIGASLERYLRQQGFIFDKQELAAAIESAKRRGVSTIHLPKGQNFQLTECGQPAKGNSK